MSSTVPSTFSQSADKATLRVYADVAWQGTVGTSSNFTSLSNYTAVTSYSFACNYNDTYTISLQSVGNTENEFGVWTVANLIQDGKMLNVGVNRLANGMINLSGQCHVAQFPMSNTGMVSFTTDKTIYQYGEPIQISGIIFPDLEKNYVLSSTILNSDGVIMRKDSTLFRGQDTFYFYVHAHGGLWKPDRYIILVEIAKSIAETDITINPAQQNQSSPIQSENHIPSWVKNTAKWWADGKISDSEFMQTMQYLVQQGIIKVPYFYSNNVSTQSLLSWIKASAGVWANGHMSDDEFVNALKYLNFQE
ncbi:MAG: hypothetical protein ACREBB_07915 [Nitrosotalea sp.]